MAVKVFTKQHVIYKIAKMLSITEKCKDEDDIFKHNRTLILSNNKEYELFVLKYFVEKVSINKYYNATIENFMKLREQTSSIKF